MKGEAVARGVEVSAGLCWAPRTMLLASGACQPCASACKSLGRGASPAWPCPWLSQLVGSARVLWEYLLKISFISHKQLHLRLLLKLRGTDAQVKNTDFFIFFFPLLHHLGICSNNVNPCKRKERSGFIFLALFMFSCPVICEQLLSKPVVPGTLGRVKVLETQIRGKTSPTRKSQSVENVFVCVCGEKGV